MPGRPGTLFGILERLPVDRGSQFAARRFSLLKPKSQTLRGPADPTLTSGPRRHLRLVPYRTDGSIDQVGIERAVL